MRKKNATIIAAILCCALKTSAMPVSAERAALVARNFWAGLIPSKTASALLDRTADWRFDGIYLFVHPRGGFVLVAADDAARPILGYSTTSVMDPDNLPVAAEEWLEGYQQQIDYLRAYGGTAYASDAAEWYRLEKGLADKDGEGVGPLLTTQWDQDAPYNDHCPAGTVTGCAATAQAQLMKYWNHPAFGAGSYTYTASSYGVQTADFGHTLYDWDHMPDRATSASSQQERDAVATLMYHCGVSLNMAYNTAAAGGSAAAGLAGTSGYHSIDNSLKDYFRYNPDMRVIWKDYGYTNDTWRAALIAELDQGHPIVYTGSARQGGHGFICDGYDGRQNMHFNFGWSGVADGYYPVDSISPGVGGIGGNVTYTFNMTNQALLGAYPIRSLYVSDTLFAFDGEGGTDSLLFSANDTMATPWSVSCDASWVTVSHDDFAHAGWVRISAASLTDGSERAATLTFRQGGLVQTVRIVQAGYTPEEMCPLTVVMESTKYDGWMGDAHLTLESANGFRFATLKLEAGRKDSATIMVAPKDVYSVWHSGGGTDRYINYYVKNQYGETYVEAEYAYMNGGTHLIAWPCAHVGINDVSADATAIYPNPTSGTVHIDCNGLKRAEVYDLGGRMTASSDSNELDLSRLPDGAYFVRLLGENGTSVRKIIKKSN